MNLSAATCNDQQLATKFKWWFTDYCIVTLHAMAAGSESSINYFLEEQMEILGKYFLDNYYLQSTQSFYYQMENSETIESNER